ncbi:MAG: tetratricopeptide repeat protein, partial [Kiritimatiellae bacterium]|nr:tetratricopeptide repeat protein [Kiritimatiellia bacterium]
NVESEEILYNLALIALRLGKFPEAREAYRRLLKRRPDWLEVKNNLAWLLATGRDLTAAEREEGVRWALDACEQTSHEDPQPLDTLGAAYASVGRFDDALRVARSALELARAHSDDQLAAKIERRSALYEKGEPYQEP